MYWVKPDLIKLLKPSIQCYFQLSKQSLAANKPQALSSLTDVYMAVTVRHKLQQLIQA